MIRRELDVGHYQPRKAKSSVLRRNSDYIGAISSTDQAPKKIEMIVNACPVMVNGESTESIECAGYGM